MDSVYVIGHRNPDTDSVVSALALAALNNALGENNYVAARIGHLNNETTFLLERFGFKPPLYLSSVRTQVCDIDYDTPHALGQAVSVSHAWNLLHTEENSVSALPIANEDGTLMGMVTKGRIAERDMESVSTPIADHIPVFNLLSALEGIIINKEQDFFDDISGEITIPLSESSIISPGMIVLCGNQKEIADRALEAGASCLILCQTALTEQYRNRSSKTCIISTPFDPYRASRMIFQAVPVGRIAFSDNLVLFHLNDYLDDVRDIVVKNRYRSYPILDEEEKIVGTLSRYHLINPKKKKIVLVDHNEIGQSVSGLDQAEIIGIIDHHRLADVQTGNPVFVRNEPIGSTTSIVATMFQEHGMMPSPNLAGLMAAAIISDTVMFKSPTCTQRDKLIAERLARISGINLEELGTAMFSCGVSPDKPVKDLINNDQKDFHLGGHSLSISQITTVDTDKFMARKDELIEELEKQRAEKKYDLIAIMITNVLKEGSDLLYAGDSEIIHSAFNADNTAEHHVYLPHVVSRKKQIVPALSQIWG